MEYIASVVRDKTWNIWLVQWEIKDEIERKEYIKTKTKRDGPKLQSSLALQVIICIDRVNKALNYSDWIQENLLKKKTSLIMAFFSIF